jgi:rhodanese-related sulfurtransferase
MREHTAASLAAEYIKKGYENAKCLGGEIDAWKNAGYPVESS